MCMTRNLACKAEGWTDEWVNPGYLADGDRLFVHTDLLSLLLCPEGGGEGEGVDEGVCVFQ